MRATLLLAALLPLVAAFESDKLQEHMRTVHHIDTSDERTFFQLHDTDGDGFIRAPELAHFYRNVGREGDEAGFQHWVDGVMEAVDMNKDEKISFEEFRRPAFADRVFSQSGQGGATVNPHAFESSAWHSDGSGSGPNRKGKDGHIEYHNIPTKYRVEL